MLKSLFGFLFLEDAPGWLVFLITTAITYETIMFMLK